MIGLLRFGPHVIVRAAAYGGFPGQVLEAHEHRRDLGAGGVGGGAQTAAAHAVDDPGVHGPAEGLHRPVGDRICVGEDEVKTIR